jgi:hypothetical protein
VIVFYVRKRNVSKLLKDSQSVGALQGQLTILGAYIEKLNVLVPFVGENPIPVSLCRPCINYQQKMLGGKAINE